MNNKKEKINLKKINLGKKAQVFTTDAVFSIILFVVILIFMLSVWNLYSQKLQEQHINSEIELLALQIADILVSSPGAPNNWEEIVVIQNSSENASNLNSTSIVTLGLANQDRKLSLAKTSVFFGFDYLILKELFNVERYDLQVRLMELNGTTLKQVG